MSPTIADNVRRFLQSHRYLTIATISPDGSPHQAVSWYLVDGDAILVNSREGRRWPANLRRDPRFSVAVEEGDENVTISGVAEYLDDPGRAQADIATMARLNWAPAVAEAAIRDRFPGEHRVSFRLVPSRIHAELEEG